MVLSINLSELSFDASGLLAVADTTVVLTGIVLNMTASAEVFNTMFQFYTPDDYINQTNIQNVSFRTMDFDLNSLNSISSFSDVLHSYIIPDQNNNNLPSGPNGTMGDDFLCYLSKKIYQSNQATNLFANGTTVVSNLNTVSNNTINSVIHNCYLDGDLNYGVSGTVTNNISPSQVILYDISTKDLSRISGDNRVPFTTVVGEPNWYYNMLIPGDMINFQIVVHPATGQKDYAGQDIAPVTYLATITLL
jgi:hypothetical protein